MVKEVVLPMDSDVAVWPLVDAVGSGAGPAVGVPAGFQNMKQDMPVKLHDLSAMATSHGGTAIALQVAYVVATFVCFSDAWEMGQVRQLILHVQPAIGKAMLTSVCHCKKVTTATAVSNTDDHRREEQQPDLTRIATPQQ